MNWMPRRSSSPIGCSTWRVPRSSTCRRWPSCWQAMEREAAAFLAALDDDQRAAAARSLRRRPAALAGVPSRAPSRAAARRHGASRPQGRPPAARHRAEPAGVRPGDGRDRPRGGARPAGGLGSAAGTARTTGSIVFGRPGDDRWAWRFEGHHLSVTMTVVDGVVSPAPMFLGANPARVDLAGRPVLRPLAVEEDMGRELLLALSPERPRAGGRGGRGAVRHPLRDHVPSPDAWPTGVHRADLRPANGDAGPADRRLPGPAARRAGRRTRRVVARRALRLGGPARPEPGTTTGSRRTTC